MVVVEQFRPVRKNTLRGFVTVQHGTGLVLHEVGLHEANGQRWAAPPARPMTRDGHQLADETGKFRWEPIVAFRSKDIRSAWSQQVVAAVERTFPEAWDSPA